MLNFQVTADFARMFSLIKMAICEIFCAVILHNMKVMLRRRRWILLQEFNTLTFSLCFLGFSVSLCIVVIAAIAGHEYNLKVKNFVKKPHRKRNSKLMWVVAMAVNLEVTLRGTQRNQLLTKTTVSLPRKKLEMISPTSCASLCKLDDDFCLHYGKKVNRWRVVRTDLYLFTLIIILLKSMMT